jgi:hypothetical protein
MKTFFVGCLGLIIGMIAGAGLILFATTAAFKPTPTATVAAPLAPAHPEVSITVNAAFAASQMQHVVRQSGVAPSAAVTFAAPNLIRMATNVEVNVLGVPLSIDVTVAMRVTVQKGRIVLTTDSVDAGGLTLPPSVASSIEPLRVQAEDEINRIVQRALQGTNLRVSSIRIAADALTIELTGQ